MGGTVACWADEPVPNPELAELELEFIKNFKLGAAKLDREERKPRLMFHEALRPPFAGVAVAASLLLTVVEALLLVTPAFSTGWAASCAAIAGAGAGAGADNRLISAAAKAAG